MPEGGLFQFCSDCISHGGGRERGRGADSGARTDDICTAHRSSRTGVADQAQYPLHRSRSRSLFGQAPKRELKPTKTEGKREALSRNRAQFTASVLEQGDRLSGGWGSQIQIPQDQKTGRGFLCWLCMNAFIKIVANHTWLGRSLPASPSRIPRLSRLSLADKATTVSALIFCGMTSLPSLSRVMENPGNQDCERKGGKMLQPRIPYPGTSSE